VEKNLRKETSAPAKREKQIVLVVDADLTRQFYTTVLLERLHYQVFPVKTAEEALMITELTAPLLIITEITLPRMSGIDLLKSVKQDPRTRDVPVLVYTALRDRAYRDECRLAGCAEYLTDPADHNQLYEAVQNATETTPRHYVRLDTSDAFVEGAAPGGGEKRERVTAISEHGMYVRTTDPLPSGSVVPFTLYLDRALAWGIRVGGQVLHSQTGEGLSGKLPGMSVKFVQIRHEDRESIRDFIRENLLSGIAKTGKTLRQ
jgi:CheY-like chemotaxis protein